MINKNEIIILAGSGISSVSKVPMVGELVDGIVKKIGIKVVNEISPKWYEQFERFILEKSVESLPTN